MIAFDEGCFHCHEPAEMSAHATFRHEAVVSRCRRCGVYAMLADQRVIRLCDYPTWGGTSVDDWIDAALAERSRS